MLILTRCVGQTIIIGDDIKVIITEIGNGHVKVGIIAPKSVSVDREEIYLKKREQAERLANEDEHAWGEL